MNAGLVLDEIQLEGKFVVEIEWWDKVDQQNGNEQAKEMAKHGQISNWGRW